MRTKFFIAAATASLVFASAAVPAGTVSEDIQSGWSSLKKDAADGWDATKKATTKAWDKTKSAASQTDDAAENVW